MPFIILFVLLPALELWVFIKVSGAIGFFLAFCLLMLSGFAGAALVRHQGFLTILAMHDSMERRKLPIDALFDEFCIIAAGVLLIFPGFATDILGLLLLVPVVRVLLRAFIRRHPGWYYSETIIIEGECERVDDDTKSLP